MILLIYSFKFIIATMKKIYTYITRKTLSNWTWRRLYTYIISSSTWSTNNDIAIIIICDRKNISHPPWINHNSALLLLFTVSLPEVKCLKILRILEDDHNESVPLYPWSVVVTVSLPELKLLEILRTFEDDDNESVPSYHWSVVDTIYFIENIFRFIV